MPGHAFVWAFVFAAAAVLAAVDARPAAPPTIPAAPAVPPTPAADAQAKPVVAATPAPAAAPEKPAPEKPAAEKPAAEKRPANKPVVTAEKPTAPEVKLAPPEAATAPLALSFTLDEAVTLAQERSFQLGRALRNKQMSDLQLDTARDGYRLRLDSNFNASQSADAYYDRSLPCPCDRSLDPWFDASVQVDATLPIDISGATRRTVDQARLSLSTSDLQIQQSRADVTLEAQNAYMMARYAQSSLEIETRMLESLQGLLAEARTRSASIVPFLEAELANSQQAIKRAATNTELSQDDLKRVLRLRLDTKLTLTTPISDQTAPIARDALLDTALVKRADMQQARLRVSQAALSVRQVDDRRAARLSVDGYYNESLASDYAYRVEGDEGSRSYGASLTLTVPLFTWGDRGLDNSRQIAILQEQQARADVDELRERIEQEIRRSVIALDRAEERIRSLPDRAKAHELLKTAERDLLSAPADRAQLFLAQLANARSLWRSAESAAVDVYFEYNLAAFRLNRAVGLDYPATVADLAPVEPAAAPVKSAAAK